MMATIGQYIPPSAVLAASPVVDPDTGLATTLLTQYIDAIVNRIGGRSATPLQSVSSALTGYAPLTGANFTGNISAPIFTGSGSGLTGTGSGFTAGSANALTGASQTATISWAATQTFTVPLVTSGYLVAGLPAGAVGMRSFVTNASAPTFGSTVVGGGAVAVPVYFDGSTWKVG